MENVSASPESPETSVTNVKQTIGTFQVNFQLLVVSLVSVLSREVRAIGTCFFLFSIKVFELKVADYDRTTIAFAYFSYPTLLLLFHVKMYNENVSLSARSRTQKMTL